MNLKTAKEALDLIAYHAKLGVVLPTTLDKIVSRPSFYEITDSRVVAYAAVEESANFQKVSSVVVHPGFQRKGLGIKVVRRTMEYARENPDKPVVAVTNGNSYDLFLKLGFVEMPKEQTPEELRGGRSEEEWSSCNRHWLQLP